MNSKNSNEIIVSNGVRIQADLKDYSSYQDLILKIWQGTDPITKTTIEINTICKEDLIDLSDFFKKLSNEAH